MTTCKHCDDTGSLSKDLEGQLDCAHCMVADERAVLDAWAAEKVPNHRCFSQDLWLIFQHGRRTPPDGFVLVPVVPTPEMLEPLANEGMTREAYRKMLNAAPNL